MDGNAKNVLKWVQGSMEAESTVRMFTAGNQSKVRNDYIKN